MKSWPSHDIFLTHGRMSCESPWQSKRRHRMLSVCYDGGKPYRTATFSCRSRRNSVAAKGLQLSRFGSSSICSASYRPIRSGGGGKGCHWNVWNYRNEGTDPKMLNLRCLLISNMIVDFMSLVWWQRNILGTTRKPTHLEFFGAQNARRAPSAFRFVFFQSTGPVESFGATVQWRK